VLQQRCPTAMGALGPVHRSHRMTKIKKRKIEDLATPKTAKQKAKIENFDVRDFYLARALFRSDRAMAPGNLPPMWWRIWPKGPVCMIDECHTNQGGIHGVDPKNAAINPAFSLADCVRIGDPVRKKASEASVLSQ
jgi:hypothetical protein